MELKTIDLSKILRPYEDKWVAISDDYKHVIVSGTSLKEIVEKCKKYNCKKPIFFKVMPFDIALAPSSL